MLFINPTLSVLAEPSEDEAQSSEQVSGEVAPSDAQLMRGVARGEAEALGALYDRFSRPLYSFASRILNDPPEAEDVLQEVFLQIWQKARSFDEAAGAPFNWAMSITRNKSIDRLRSRQRRQQLLQSPAAEMITGPESPATQASENLRCDLAGQLRATVEELPAEQRRPIELAFFRGLTHLEIARELQQPLGTIKARIRRGLTRLRDGLELEPDDNTCYAS